MILSDFSSRFWNSLCLFKGLFIHFHDFLSQIPGVFDQNVFGYAEIGLGAKKRMILRREILPL